MNIVDYLSIGKENAITREMLRTITSMPDRAVREAVEQARHDGYIIINDQSGIGYYLCDSDEKNCSDAELNEIERQYRQNESRAKSILHYQKFLRRKLKAAGRL